jgi:threonine dehydratase
MTLLAERPLVEARPGLTLAELPNSLEVANNILERAQPLAEDAQYRDLFYDHMGTVRTELQPVTDVNGASVLVKKEYEQASGAYKQRGANHAVLLAALKAHGRATEVVTYSTGNHAASVVNAVEAANALGENMTATLEVTTTMSPAKRALVKGRATIHENDSFDDARQAATARRDQPDTLVVDPFGHEDVVAGQYSLGLEVVEDLVARGLVNEDVTIPVSTAGAGHLAGVALAVWQAKRQGVLGENVKVVAVQPTNTDALGRAVAKVRNGEDPQNLFLPDELDKDCDALAIDESSLSPTTLAIAADPQFVHSFTTVDKPDLAVARHQLSAELGVELEPAAALPMAYAQQHARPGQHYVLPVTGKNVAPETVALYNSHLPFTYLSARYLERAQDGLEELAAHSRREQLGVWAGATALFRDRQGLVTPIPRASR